jgi:hypothetical protein
MGVAVGSIFSSAQVQGDLGNQGGTDRGRGPVSFPGAYGCRCFGLDLFRVHNLLKSTNERNAALGVVILLIR